MGVIAKSRPSVQKRLGGIAVLGPGLGELIVIADVGYGKSNLIN